MAFTCKLWPLLGHCGVRSPLRGARPGAGTIPTVTRRHLRARVAWGRGARVGRGRGTRVWDGASGVGGGGTGVGRGCAGRRGRGRKVAAAAGGGTSRGTSGGVAALEGVEQRALRLRVCSSGSSRGEGLVGARHWILVRAAPAHAMAYGPYHMALPYGHGSISALTLQQAVSDLPYLLNPPNLPSLRSLPIILNLPNRPTDPANAVSPASPPPQPAQPVHPTQPAQPTRPTQPPQPPQPTQHPQPTRIEPWSGRPGRGGAAPPGSTAVSGVALPNALMICVKHVCVKQRQEHTVTAVSQGRMAEGGGKQRRSWGQTEGQRRLCSAAKPGLVT